MSNVRDENERLKELKEEIEEIESQYQKDKRSYEDRIKQMKKDLLKRLF